MLEHGADPNVVIESDFNSRGGMIPGDSVTHLACATSFPGYFEAVFANGGDPNLARTTRISFDETPLFTVIMGGAPDKPAKIKLLIAKGADLDHIDRTGMTATMTAVGFGGQFEIAQILLEAGADFRIYQKNQAQRLIHVVARQDTRLVALSAQQRSAYNELISWLEQHGESLDAARDDIKRWDSWSRTTGEYRKKMDEEIAARKAREAREKVANEDKAKVKP